MKLRRSVIEEQIRNGTFKPVWAGTLIPQDRDELPSWANPDCPD